MQDQAIEIGGLQIAKRCGEGLGHLFGQRRVRVVGNIPRILAGDGREFALQIQIRPDQRASRLSATPAPTPGSS